MPKTKKKLTETEIKAAKPEAKNYFLYDEGGLRLLVRPTGTKVWQFPYKFNSKYNIFTIGQYDPNGRVGFISSAEARKKRDEVRVLIKAGIDPNSSKKTQLQEALSVSENNFEVVAREWFGKQVWAKKHGQNILRTLEKDVFPDIGSKPIDQISAKDIIAILTKIEARDAVDVAKRVNQRCTAIFDYAIVKGICENNPAAGRAKFIKARKTQHRPYLKEDQLPEFLAGLELYRGGIKVQLAMQLLMLTFVRPGELRFAEWAEIDFHKAEWRIPAERMKMRREHIVPLSTQALSVIEEIKKISGQNKLLFPGVKGDGRPISDVTLTKVLRIMGYTKENNRLVVPHGMRATASTILNQNGFRADVIERQLAHEEQNKIRAAYHHAEYLDERKQMMQWWADYLDKKRMQYVRDVENEV